MVIGGLGLEEVGRGGTWRSCLGRVVGVVWGGNVLGLQLSATDVKCGPDLDAHTMSGTHVYIDLVSRHWCGSPLIPDIPPCLSVSAHLTPGGASTVIMM